MQYNLKNYIENIQIEMRERLEENIPHTKKIKQHICNWGHNFCKYLEEESPEHTYQQRKETSVKEILKI